MKKIIVTFLIILLTIPAAANVRRIKDLARLDGIKENQLFGFGLVIGLSGTGDSKRSLATIQMVQNMLIKLGINIDAENIAMKNVAAVMVTSNLPPFAQIGDKLDIQVASIGDAKNISGGILLQTPLQGANGKIYAVGQGKLAFNETDETRRKYYVKRREEVTTSFVNDGAIVERAINSNILSQNNNITFVLKEPDYTTSERISQAINATFSNTAKAQNAQRIVVNVPAKFRNNIAEFVSIIENLNIKPDKKAKVVINQVTGTIIMGENVTIDPVAISHGDLKLNIKKQLERTAAKVQPDTKMDFIELKEQELDLARLQDRINNKTDAERIINVKPGVNVSQVVNALNAIGAKPNDVIAILQAAYQMGALNAKLVIIN